MCDAQSIGRGATCEVRRGRGKRAQRPRVCVYAKIVCVYAWLQSSDMNVCPKARQQTKGEGLCVLDPGWVAGFWVRGERRVVGVRQRATMWATVKARCGIWDMRCGPCEVGYGMRDMRWDWMWDLGCGVGCGMRNRAGRRWTVDSRRQIAGQRVKVAKLQRVVACFPGRPHVQRLPAASRSTGVGRRTRDAKWIPTRDSRWTPTRHSRWTPTRDGRRWTRHGSPARTSPQARRRCTSTIHGR